LDSGAHLPELRELGLQLAHWSAVAASRGRTSVNLSKKPDILTSRAPTE
jgi:hypothetical protein